MKESQHTRLYFDPLARWILRGFEALLIIVSLTLVLAKPSADSALARHHVAMIIIRLAFGLVLVAVTAYWRVVSRLGVQVSPVGIAIGRQFRIRPRFLAWNEIKEFRSSPSLRQTVCAELWSGDEVRMPLIQGRNMRWRGEASRDIVAVLGRELPEGRPQ